MSKPTSLEDIFAFLLSGRGHEVNGHRIYLDEHGFWLTNPYGCDAFFSATRTVATLERLMRELGEGALFGQVPLGG